MFLPASGRRSSSAGSLNLFNEFSSNFACVIYMTIAKTLFSAYRSFELQRVQNMQNMTAKMVTQSKKFERVTPRCPVSCSDRGPIFLEFKQWDFDEKLGIFWFLFGILTLGLW